MKETPTTEANTPPALLSEEWAALRRTTENKRQAELEEKVKTFLAQQPAELDCEIHPGQKRELAPERTRDKCVYDRLPDRWEPVYFGCPLCIEARIQDELLDAGVPDTLLHCSLDNWTPRDPAEKQHLQDCRDFAENVRIGFLILLGPVGVGKSHLAAGVARFFPKRHDQQANIQRAVWIQQSALLRQLRATYGDNEAEDPIEKCKAARLLVLDEAGLSGGGRDEAPMLHEILDYRYGHKRPTVITSNLSWDDLQAELGPRLADRMRESAYRVLVFSGSSHRAEQRDNYFASPGKPTQIRTRGCMS